MDFAFCAELDLHSINHYLRQDMFISKSVKNYFLECSFIILQSPQDSKIHEFKLKFPVYFPILNNQSKLMDGTFKNNLEVLVEVSVFLVITLTVSNKIITSTNAKKKKTVTDNILSWSSYLFKFKNIMFIIHDYFITWLKTDIILS